LTDRIISKMLKLLENLICVSEKAANLARACRSDTKLFELLVEEKTGDAKNAKFVQDFKTLADVLIQETVRHDLSKTFPALENSIFGEESNEFENTIGEKIVVSVQENEQKTKDLLTKVLNGNSEAAQILAQHVHSEIKIKDVNTTSLPDTIPEIEFDIKDIGIWIDPIDATSQYIKGGIENVSADEPPTKGLKVVTVLIGAYSLSSGAPCLGVVNQPFSKISSSEEFSGSAHWGGIIGTVKFNSMTPTVQQRTRPRVLIGSTEDPDILEKLDKCSDVIKAGGAGHKLLMVALGLADVYINSGASTYKWDTCAPHAIIRALGGEVKECQPYLSENNEKSSISIFYVLKEGKGDKQNTNGLFAFRDEKMARIVLEALTH